jgi:hypothetical protein
MSTKNEQDEAVNGELVQYDPSLFPTLQEQDPAEVAARFARRFEQAENLDDLFNVLQGNSSKTMVGRSIEILEVAFVPYESDHGVIPNAICQAADIDTGELLEFATTGQMTTMFLAKVVALNILPVQVKIVEKKTRGGRSALNFERV